MYNLIRIAAGVEKKTAFCTKQGLFKYTVMTFGLTNMYESFQEMMDTIFQDMEGCIQYLDDILVYGDNTGAEYQAIAKKGLQQCVKHVLEFKLFTSEFHVYKTILLKYVINGQDIKVDLSKLATMFKWPILIEKKEVQAFLIFANNYHPYIINYSTKSCLHIKLTKDMPNTLENT